MAGEQRRGIVWRDSLLDPGDFNEGIETADELGGERGLGLARVARAVDRLAVEVGEVRRIGIDDGEAADASAGERRNDRRADAAGADHRDLGGFQALLTGPAEVGEHDLAGVAGEFFVGQQCSTFRWCRAQSRHGAQRSLDFARDKRFPNGQ